MVQKEVEFLIGETASGKTEFLKELSKKEDFVVFNCDSRQIYRYLDIGTAKPDKEFLSKVYHYFVDITEYDKNFSVGDFYRKFKEYLKKEDKRIILSVGTPFYLKTILFGIDDIPEISTEIKRKVKQMYQEEGLSNLYNLLKKVDKERSLDLNENDKQRILRSLEVYFQTGKPITYFFKKKKNIQFKIRNVKYLYREKSELKERIERRINLMLKDGLIEEVEKLRVMYGDNIFFEKPVIGYIEPLSYIKGKITKDRMVEDIVKNSMSLVKRQRTFFKKILKELSDCTDLKI